MRSRLSVIRSLPGPPLIAALVTVVLVAAVACSSTPTRPPARAAGPLAPVRTDLDVQSLVMNMSDDLSGAVAEAMNPVVSDPVSTQKARAFAQSFLRSTTASSVDIAVSPNPDAALLDMLVLASLTRWSFEQQRGGCGMTESQVARASERLGAAEAELWKSGASVLSDAQTRVLRALIDDWKTDHPSQTDVAFVRFNDFLSLRDRAGASGRVRATGLLREVTEASAVVDSARLLGERAVWYAGRYPAMVAQQAEDTAYRLADQPELRRALEAVDAARDLAQGLTRRLDALDADLDRQRGELFSEIARERERTIADARAAVEAAGVTLTKDAEQRMAACIDRAFDRFAKERHEFLDDLEAREGTLRSMATELRSTIAATTGLANELTGTVGAIDRIVERFDRPATPGQKPLEITDIRDAAIEATKAAEKTTVLLERLNQVADSVSWDRHIAGLGGATTGAIDRAFWRGLALVVVLVVGLALVRLVPQRVADRPKGAPAPTK